MATLTVGLGAAGIVYLLWKQQNSADEMEASYSRTDIAVERAPSTWAESFHTFKEVFRFTIQETIGRWNSLDLFFGLAFLAQREAQAYPAADLAAAGSDVSSSLALPEAQRLAGELREVRRYLGYCLGLKQATPEARLRVWRERLGLNPADILVLRPDARFLQPAHMLVADHTLKAVVLCIRGTQRWKDLLTSLSGSSKPHHLLRPDGGVEIGYSHLGMLAAARWLEKQLFTGPGCAALQALQAHPGYALKLVGHSMGGGTAALLTTILRSGNVAAYSQVTCVAVACPACMSSDLAQGCAAYVTSVLHGTDVVPTFSPYSSDDLRHEVLRSSWFAQWRRDASGRIMRAMEGGVSSATQWTASRIAQPFRSCYARPGTAGNSPTVSRSLSDNDFEPGCMVRDDTGAGGGEGGAGATTSSVLRLLTFGNLRKRTVGGGAPPQQAAAFSSLEDAAAAAAAAGGDDVVTAEAGAAASDASGSSGAGAAYLLQAPQAERIEREGDRQQQLRRRTAGGAAPGAAGGSPQADGSPDGSHPSSTSPTGASSQRSAAAAGIVGAGKPSAPPDTPGRNAAGSSGAGMLSSGVWGTVSSRVATLGSQTSVALGRTVNRTSVSKVVGETSAYLKVKSTAVARKASGWLSRGIPFRDCRPTSPPPPPRLGLGGASALRGAGSRQPGSPAGHGLSREPSQHAEAAAALDALQAGGGLHAASSAGAGAGTGAPLGSLGSMASMASMAASAEEREALEEGLEGLEGLEDGGEDDGGLEGDSDNDSGPDEDGGSGPSGGRRLHAGISAIAAAVVAEGHSRDAEEQEREAEAILQEAEDREAAEAQSSGVDGPMSPSRRRHPPADAAEPPDALLHGLGGETSAAAGASAADAPSAAPTAEELRAKQRLRQLFPAGRILHLLPRHALSDGLSDLMPPRDERQPFPLPPESPAGAGFNGASASGATALPEPSSPTPSATPFFRSRLGADLEDPLSASTNPLYASQPPLTPSGTSASAATPYVLMAVPREAYGRIRLCKTMVYDHFVPQYLRALDSVLAQLEGRQ